MSPAVLCNHLFSSLQTTLNLYAPSISRTVKTRPNTDWYNDDLKTLKRARRACERRLISARQRNLDVSLHLSQLKTATKTYFSVLSQTRFKYTRDLISSSGDSHKTLLEW